MLKCKNYLYFALFVLSALFIGSFIITQNSFATSQSFTVDLSSVSRNSYISLSNYGITLTKVSFIDISYQKPSSLYNCRSYVQDASTVSYFSFNLKTNSQSQLDRLSEGENHFVYFNPVMNLNVLYFSSSSSSCPIGDWIVTVTVSDVFISSSSPTPSGNIDIVSNGIYDVTNYASAIVNVPAEVIQGDYHDDLVNIQKSIIICGAILLVLYFFYCIYRLIIRNSGVH